MSSRKQSTQEEFVAMLQHAGLDPAQYNVAELYAAWLLLDSHMQRLRVPPAGISESQSDRQTARHPAVQSLGIFNPHDVSRKPCTGDA